MPPEQDPQQPQNDNGAEQESSAQRRINQLFAQKKEAEETLASERANNDQLQTQLLRLQDELATIRNGGSAGLDSALGTPGQQISGNTDVVQQLDQRFKEFERKMEEREQAKYARATLSFNQQQSMQRALAEFPELQHDQQLFQMADRIYKADKAIAEHQNGPYMAVMLAKGALAGSAESADSALSAARAASSSGPSAAPAAPGSGNTAEINDLRQKLAKAEEDMQAGRGDPAQAWVKYRDLKIKLGMLTEPDRVGEMPKFGPQG